GFIAVFGAMDYFRLTITPAATAGALLAFVLLNFYPAKLRAGRVGGAFVGGMAAAWAWCIGWPGLLPLLAAVVLAEGGSVLLQLVYARLRGRPLFKTSPLHHHVLLSGWSETRLCAVYSAAAVVCMLLTLLFVRVS
ncbi:MAG: hypothetical protein IJ347_07005, partial [Faecalibacterium sp.]|nr:hypothetical protein [Faecalibacterium sp.]